MLAALQAYLLYSMMLFFEHSSPKRLVEQDVMIKLQSLAGDVAGSGTICPAERRDTRPDWESWIVASAKQRTLFVTSMFDNLVNFALGTPSFIQRNSQNYQPLRASASGNQVIAKPGIWHIINT